MSSRGSLELSTAEAKVHQIKSELCIRRRATGLASPDNRSTGFDTKVRLKTASGDLAASAGRRMQRWRRSPSQTGSALRIAAEAHGEISSHSAGAPIAGVAEIRREFRNMRPPLAAPLGRNGRPPIGSAALRRGSSETDQKAWRTASNLLRSRPVYLLGALW